MRSELFLDASYAIALGSPRDQLHTAAVSLAGRIELENSRLVTTRAVLLEIGNALVLQLHIVAPSFSPSAEVVSPCSGLVLPSPVGPGKHLDGIRLLA